MWTRYSHGFLSSGRSRVPCWGWRGRLASPASPRVQGFQGIEPCIPGPGSISLLVLNISGGDARAKEDIPAQQQQAKEDTRLQGPYGDQRRSPGTETAPSQGSQKADSEWIALIRSGFRGACELCEGPITVPYTVRGGRHKPGGLCSSAGRTDLAIIASESRSRAKSGTPWSGTGSSACSERFFAGRTQGSLTVLTLW
jgi:hypothetical protein